MNFIERVQRKLVFEEAAKSSIVNSRLLQLPQILAKIIGVSDIGVRSFGLPMAPIYNAVEGEEISVNKMADYFKGLNRDLKTVDFSLTEIEADLIYMNLEFWSRIQSVKNRSADVTKRAYNEKNKLSTGGTWLYTETFSNTNNIDMQNTSAWLDTSEGIAFLPNTGVQQVVKPSDIRVVSQTQPSNGSFLGSSASMAFDGLNNTNWRCMFSSQDTPAECVVELQNVSDINSVTIDPIGFGLSASIDIDSGTGFNNVLKVVVYNKSTFQINNQSCKRLRISFVSEGSSFPRLAGIREFVLYTSNPSNSASIVSKLLKPAQSYTDIKVELKAQVPSLTSLKTFYGSSSAGPWIEVVPNVWNATTSKLSTVINASPYNASAISDYRGLYGISLIALNAKTPLTTSEGRMLVGRNQLEVNIFKKDWIEEGAIPRILQPEDFKQFNTLKTWSNVITNDVNTDQICIQEYGQTNISADPQVSKGGNVLAFQRTVTASSLSSDDRIYRHLCIVPLIGDKNRNPLQYKQNYSLKFYVYAPKQFTYTDAKYWFLQGFRQAERRSYRELGKSYCGFTLLVNDNVVAGDSAPYTLYTDRSSTILEDGTEQGRPFSLFIKEGWNKIEILISLTQPEDYGTDVADIGDPYVQLSIFPSLFDQAFKEDTDHLITDIVASGEVRPSTEFDLMWNLPQSPLFWAWSEDRGSVLFNTKQVKISDGYFSGILPDCYITYKGVENDIPDDLYIKVDLLKETNSSNSPILDEYTVTVR